MTKLTTLILLMVFTSGALCSDISIGELPYKIAKELQMLSNEGITEMKLDCSQRRRPAAHFLLYTRNTTDDPILLDIGNSREIDSSKQVILLIHGWLSGPSSSGILKIKDAYLERYDCNVIVVDWTQLSEQPYTNAACNVMGAAQMITKFVCHLDKELQIRPSTLHIVAHSMGAHVAGVVGQLVAVRCKDKVGRITGLDPSGPIFQKMGVQQRLDKTDANFVDVIHTDTARLGSFMNCGHVDFYVNCGRFQPGCPTNRAVSDEKLVSKVMCNTLRSLEYMAESINSRNFIGVSCSMCPHRCHADALSEVYEIMGEDCQPSKSKMFYIPTKSSAPYAEALRPYSL